MESYNWIFERHPKFFSRQAWTIASCAVSSQMATSKWFWVIFKLPAVLPRTNMYSFTWQHPGARLYFESELCSESVCWRVRSYTACLEGNIRLWSVAFCSHIHHWTWRVTHNPNQAQEMFPRLKGLFVERHRCCSSCCHSWRGKKVWMNSGFIFFPLQKYSSCCKTIYRHPVPFDNLPVRSLCANYVVVQCEPEWMKSDKYLVLLNYVR